MKNAAKAGAALGAAFATASIIAVGIDKTGESSSPDRVASPCIREDDGTFTWRWPPIPDCIRKGWIVLGPGGKEYRYPGP